MVEAIVGAVVGVVVLGGVAATASFRVITEYERAVVFRLGRLREEAKGPGMIVRVPFVDRFVRLSLRVEVVDIPQQAVITADNVTVQVDAVVYFQVTDPVRAVVGVDNYRFASQRVAMTALRSIIGRHELDNILAHRDDVNTELRASIATSTHNWGVEVRQVEIRDIVLSHELLRAMARQAEAERERRAKVINATGELEASRELSEAAAMLNEAPGALQLRTLQTLTEVATEHNSTLIFPIPIELMAGFRGLVGSQVDPAGSTHQGAAGPAGEAGRLGEADLASDGATALTANEPEAIAPARGSEEPSGVVQGSPEHNGTEGTEGTEGQP